ncbi:MAG: cytochrome c oxidase assembly protein [Sphingomonadales bacterium]
MTTVSPDIQTRNQRTMILVVSVVIGMIGLSFASVPLYRLFCQVTGYGGTTQVADTSGINSYDMPILDRQVRVSFTSDTQSDLPWEFEPMQRRVTVNLGEEVLVYYRARNVSDQPVTGTAIFNVTPFKSGPYFSKIECFCFTEQTLQPGEEMIMPVTFFVDPLMDGERNLDDVREITLSYTFFEARQ